MSEDVRRTAWWVDCEMRNAGDAQGRPEEPVSSAQAADVRRRRISTPVTSQRFRVSINSTSSGDPGRRHAARLHAGSAVNNGG